MKVSSKFTFQPEGFLYTKSYKLTVTYLADSDDIEELEVFVDDGEKFDVWELLSAELQVEITTRIFEDMAGVLSDMPVYEGYARGGVR